jgi:hypothetical protein
MEPLPVPVGGVWPGEGVVTGGAALETVVGTVPIPEPVGGVGAVETGLRPDGTAG